MSEEKDLLVDFFLGSTRFCPWKFCISIARCIYVKYFFQLSFQKYYIFLYTDLGVFFSGVLIPFYPFAFDHGSYR